jgi:hypothetical protein
MVAGPSSEEARNRGPGGGATRRWGRIVSICCMFFMFYGSFMPCSINLQSTCSIPWRRSPWCFAVAVQSPEATLI